MNEVPKVRKSDIPDDERLRELQRKLYRKAKEEKSFRFYMLYDKIFIPYVLRLAYKRCKENGGSPGIDNITFESIEQKGVKDFLDDLREDLLKKTYKPSMVKRVYIEKANGKQRPLGIPTIRDRVAQMACKMILEPIFEADFHVESYGYRPKRSAQNAIAAIKDNLKQGYTEVYDADLSAFFDTIPHKELMILVGRRVSDKYVLHLIKMWLKAPVFENGSPTGGKKNSTGTPQGGVISPLLANIYLNLMDDIVTKPGGYFESRGIRLIRYADDFLLMARVMEADVIAGLSRLLDRLKLTLNQEKSRQVDATQESFDFLGFTFRYDRDLYGVPGKRYWNIVPSKRAQQQLRDKLRAYFRWNSIKTPWEISAEINMMTRGWIQYFYIPGVSYPSTAVRLLRHYLGRKVHRLYKRKSQRKSQLHRTGAYKTLVQKYGLVEPTQWLKRLKTSNA
ncbi:MAG: group II intron reverse transcriptase/maturase [Bacteroidetes bacterium]|nr:group II intron reverse transcriptase/maturase [Bacteroidota bacterium]